MQDVPGHGRNTRNDVPATPSDSWIVRFDERGAVELGGTRAPWLEGADRSPWAGAVAAALRGEMEPRAESWNGRPVTVRPVMHVSAVGGMLVVVDDEPRTRAALEAAALRERADSLLRASLDCIITIDAEGRVVEFNDVAERTFGHARENVLGRLMSDVIVPPQYREAHCAGMRHYAKTGEGPVLGKRIEISALRADGTEFPCELAISPTSAGGRNFFTAYLRDLTERHATERDRRIARFTIEQAAEAVFWIASDASVVDANPTACRMLGFDREELLGRKVFDIDAMMTPEIWPTHWQELSVAGSLVIESRHRGRDGIEFPVEVRCHLIEVDGEAINCVLVSDIRERKATERRLAEGRRRVEFALASAGLGFWDWSPSTDEWVCDDRCLEIVGAGGARAESRPDGRPGDLIDAVHPDDRTRFHEHRSVAMSTGSPEAEIDVRVTDEHGGTRWIRERVRAAEVDAAGRPSRLIGTVEDVTARRVRRERDDRMSSLHAVAGAVADRGHRAGSVQAIAELLLEDLIRVGGICGAGLHVLGSSSHGLDSASRGCAAVGQIGVRDHAWRAFRDTDSSASSSVRIADACDEGCGGDSIAIPIRVGAELTAALVVELDAACSSAWSLDETALVESAVDRLARTVERRESESARRDAERRLREALVSAEAASEAKGRFLAHLSHELRTPLTSVIGGAEILEGVDHDRAEADRMRTMIATSGRQLLGVLDDVLDLSKIEAGKIELAIEDVPVSRLVETIDAFAGPAERAGLVYRMIVDPETPSWLRFDPTRLDQVITNLLSNAVKYTGEGGIVVRVEHEPATRRDRDDELVVSIRDTGPGIPIESRDRIFEPFERGSAASGGMSGSGLGLSITKRLVDLMGGQLDLRSTPGEGCCFTVRIPVDAARARQTPVSLVRASDATVMNRRALDGVRVLLADDTDAARDVIRHFLVTAGAEVVAVVNGREAVDAVRDRPAPDIILLDMRMPVLDGYGAAKEIRASGATMPIVALTAQAMSSDRSECLAAGCDEHLAKPIDAATLVRRCAEMLGRPILPEPRSAPTSPSSAAGDAPWTPRLATQDGVPAKTAPSPSVPPQLAERFRATLGRDAEEIRRLIAAEDFEGLEDITHRLAGTSACFGYQRLGATARACLNAVRRRELDRASARASEVLVQIERVRSAGSRESDQSGK